MTSNEALKMRYMYLYEELKPMPLYYLAQKYWHYKEKHGYHQRQGHCGSVTIDGYTLTFQQIAWMYLCVLVKIFKERNAWHVKKREPIIHLD